MPEKIQIETKKGTTLKGDFYDNNSKQGIILLPGFSEHRASMEETAKHLNKDFKTWTFDLNSQGESTGNWNLEEMQESTQDLAKQLKKEHALKKIGVFGNSVGGMAAGIAATYEDSIDALCLTSTPAALQETILSQAASILKYTPQSLLRQAMIAFDRTQSWINENYRERTHKQFYENNRYKDYAQFGAVKIRDAKEFARNIKEAPRLDEYTDKIRQPILFLFGGKDKIIGMKNGFIPEKIKRMYEKTGSKDKNILIIAGADHSMNTRTGIDDNFNQDPKYAFVKNNILNHFSKYML